MTKSKFTHSYQYIISIGNLLEAWKEFRKGKHFKKDVQEFELHLMDNILSLHRDLLNKTYIHSKYELFRISDPKPRKIHKASVRDRLLHRALYRKIYPFFDRTFISDSYSCRLGKGTHKAMNRLRKYAYQASENHTKTIWILKCDIQKFFYSIDKTILIRIVNDCIEDDNLKWLTSKIINSFENGLPLGNITSQLFANVYLNELDQFAKHKLKASYYIRYADDFIILSQGKQKLKDFLFEVKKFLQDELKLKLHGQKVYFKTYSSGIDFLGWIHFNDYRQIRKSTKKRIARKLNNSADLQTIASYKGLLSHGNAYKLQCELGLAEY
ncbi:MAG: reverse transcriptase domain-containing protein [Candidatus Paceibacterota bacterium]|jgi:retron-type reverse transcriptase|nr:reverse transcriptase domain-containing protein [Candidatus Paceibacterota bacterium]MDD5621053.1 reverse transcriptase domain-containing protein [Candidatus Paceibacterota bacterium]